MLYRCGNILTLFTHPIHTGDYYMTVAQQVGENLRTARKAKGMTQQKVAEAMNKYQSDYSDYERGLIQLDYDKILFLCHLFDITPNELFYMG